MKPVENETVAKLLNTSMLSIMRSIGKRLEKSVNLNDWPYFLLGLICFISLPVGSAQQADSGEAEDLLYFNQKRVPESLADLMAIEAALKASLQDVQDAVVGIKIGEGEGSGVIVSEDGLIMSAAHVTSGVGKNLTVIMPDGTEHQAKALGLRSDYDAALAKIEGDGPFPFVEIRDEVPHLGEWVFSLGHSGGFDVDRGSVARIGRIVRRQDHTVQSDCTLIGGDSGGPLFDMQGNLVGIHSRVSRSFQQNMHVTIPIFTEAWDQMMQSEFIGEGPFAQKISGFLGVAVVEADGGLEVERVASDAAASNAGIEVGDLLVEMNGEALQSKEIFSATLSEMLSGQLITLKWLRNGEEMQAEIELGEKLGG